MPSLYKKINNIKEEIKEIKENKIAKHNKEIEKIDIEINI